MASEFASHVSPISLFNIDAKIKLNNSSFFKEVKQATKGMTFGLSFDKWWDGHHLDTYSKIQANPKLLTPERAAIFNKGNRARSLTRKVTVGLLGGSVAGALAFGHDHPLTKTSNLGLSAGATALGAGVAVNYGKSIGNSMVGRGMAAGILGFSAINLSRKGDQMGPF